MDAETLDVSLTADDGYELGGTLYPAAGAETAVIMHGATAVPHRFYGRFARHLQARGWSVLTYDFRGIGASRPRMLRGFEAKASDWGLLDMPAATDWVRRRLLPKRLFFVGHSAGGQQAGLLARPEHVDAMATVSSQSGHWRLQGGSEKLRVLVLVSVVIPLLARMHGYLPWGKFGSGEDLPKLAALQWAGWCRSRDYILGDDNLPLDRYQRFTAPVLAYSIDDDDWGTARSVRAMMRAYPNVEYRHIVPADYGLERVGHMGYFRAGSEPLWDEVYDWLDAQG